MSAAFDAGVNIERLVIAADDAAWLERARSGGLETMVVTPEVMARLAPTVHPRGPLAVVEEPPTAAPHGRDTLVLWGVRDPGNAGTIVRSAAAFGVGVLAGPGTVDLWSPKAIRAGAGGHFVNPPHTDRSITLTKLADLGFSTVASVPSGGAPPNELSIDLRLAILIGDESGGLPPDIIGACHQTVTLPMTGQMESLNAAVAGSILAYLRLGRSTPPSR